MNVAELSSKQADLLQQQNDLALQIEQAKQKEYNDKLQQIDNLSAEANDFRQQAERAKSDIEKRALYSYAAENEKQANDIRKQLGIYQESTDTNVNELFSNNNLNIVRKVNSMFMLSVTFLITYLIGEFGMTNLDAGFFYTIVKTFSGISYFFASAFGGFWIVLRVVKTFFEKYILDDLEQDFKCLTAFQKLIILVAILFGILHFLNSLLPHAN